MSDLQLLSMTKAIAYLGDATNAQQLLGTLKSTLEVEIPKIEAAIEAKNFEMLQKTLHQLKGFAPVFCQDILVEKIVKTESLCKHTETDAHSENALSASLQLVTNLNNLQLEVSVQLQQTV